MENKNNALQPVQQGTQPVTNWTREEINTIKLTVAKDATDAELSMFLHLASSYGLDPFARDIWFIKDSSGRPIIMTSRDGYIKIANNNPNYDNMDADVVYQGDRFRKTPDGVEHIYATQNRGAPVGAYAMVYRKDRSRPVYVYAPFNDYRKNSPVWRQYPHAMILKVAESMALKRAFSISGLVTREELSEEDYEPTSAAPANKSNDTKNQEKSKKQKIDNEKLYLYKRFTDACGSQTAAQSAMLAIVDNKPSKDWDELDLKKLWDGLNDLENPEPEQAQEQAPADAPAEILDDLDETLSNEGDADNAEVI